MKKYFNLIIYLSFIFLLVFLIRQDYVRPRFNEPLFLIASLIFLFGGFFLSTLSWQQALRVHGVRIALKTAVISHGQAIFSKYIPGKIWVILGRAGYISGDRKSMGLNSFISLKEQMVYVWDGLVISTIPTFIFYGFRWFTLMVAGITLALTLVLFSARIHDLTFMLLGKLIKKNLEFPIIRFREALPMILYTSFIWLSWSAGFLLFSFSLSGDTTAVMAFSFPLSVSLGVMALIMPGGLGVRESVITGYLILCGMGTEDAATVSMMSRFWFIAGEVFIFITSLIVGKLRRKQPE